MFAKVEKSICYNAATFEFSDGERRREMHTFKVGDTVTVFQMHPRRGLEIEGKARVVRRVADVDEQYIVVFHRVRAGENYGERYERFVDTWGQDNPEKYVREFNKKIGVAA